MTEDLHPKPVRDAVEGVVEARRGFLKSLAAAGAVAGAAAAGAGVIAAPHVASAQGAGRVLRIQSSWQPGTTGFRIFETWADGLMELTGGEVGMKAFPAGAVAGDFQLVDAVRNGVLDGMNLFTVYWAGRMPAGVFLSSYPMGLNHPHHWDMMFNSYGGNEIARELYQQNGLHFVGHVHHDMNLIHSKRPITSLDDFNGLLLRVPGGIVADCFASIGARTTLLPGSEVYPALERGTIEAADFTGPAVNYDLGFHQVTQYIVMGPPSTPCLHQPVDLMDISLSQRVWNSLSPKMQELLPQLVKAYSAVHYGAIQEANRAAWPKYAEAGVEVTRLSEEDAARFRQVAIPKWFEWANKDKDAARLFKVHLDVMQDPSVAYITPEDIKDHQLNL
ncbi:TRAP transporter substrate-binding protein DctP [Arenibaculum sp.]|jgi:TRAP-type mannitol/chloroaromatic compound transport system substrate-binding protein|uniref:TRAP transporter substrate-binding protein DctP n=1 Tax=Arenibaculum sp. TaxID=2865862 RepID=UPI002E0D5E67|nr:TRAP transporter substrate-binding protein DctP [Arenibaculum sp.]